MKKIFLTSAICMIVAMPSYADIASDAESATCDNTTIGATENNTDLEALWTAAQYTEPAGQYLLFNNNTVSQHQTCPAGSFCPGFTNQNFADASMGLQTCPTGYTNSAAGASADTQCYRACSGNVTIAHATGVTGNDYYGNGTDTCAPTGCDAGYHVKAATPDLTALIGLTDAGTKAVYKGHAASYSSSAADLTAYGLTDYGEFVVDYGNKGKVHGYGLCSDAVSLPTGPGPDVNPADITTTSEALTHGWAVQCWCKLDTYTPSGGSAQNTQSLWVFRASGRSGYTEQSDCIDECPRDCATMLNNNNATDIVYRTAVFNSIESGSASCEANTITIDWDPKNGGAHTQNQCTYGGAVTIPATPSKPGYIFGGWKVKTN